MTMIEQGSAAIDGRWYRTVLGRYPTGVSVVTALDGEGRPVGLAVGSFTSVSLDPPLVAFLPDRTSTSWPRIREAGVFCVNILASEQEPVCRAFASKAPDKFTGLTWRRAGSGSPIIDGVVAWIDCDLEAVYPAGDHDIVIGRVRALGLAEPGLPLVFYEGGYGRFEPLSRAAADADLIDVLRDIDPARGEMERIAADLGVECVAGVTVGEEIVHVASAGTPAEGVIPVRVGMRSPLVPPLGASWIAWEQEQEIERWLGHCTPPLSDEEREAWRHALARQRRRGWWIRLGGATQQEFDEHIARLTSQPPADRRRAFGELFRGPLSGEYAQPDLEPDGAYDVRAISAPVFCPDGHTIRYALILFGLPEPCRGSEVQRYANRLVEGCRAATAAVGARPR